MQSAVSACFFKQILGKKGRIWPNLGDDHFGTTILLPEQNGKWSLSRLAVGRKGGGVFRECSCVEGTSGCPLQGGMWDFRNGSRS